MSENTHSLKPCPFCGSDKVQSGGEDKIVGVWCHDCAATGPNGYQTSSADWNTRPNEDSLAATIASQESRIEALTKALDRAINGPWSHKVDMPKALAALAAKEGDA